MACERTTVLAVDDEPSLPELYRAFLPDEYHVLIARDGEEALDVVHEGVEVIILDRDMPRMAGDEFLRQYRAAGGDAGVVIVSGMEPDEDVLALSFDAYLSKPVERETLTHYVAAMCRRQAYTDTVKEYCAVASKLALIDPEAAQNGKREAYSRLVDRCASLRTAANDKGADFDAEYHRLAIPNPTP